MLLKEQNRQNAIENAQKILAQKPIYIDSETTGLDKTDEIIELAIIDHDGTTLFDSFIRPSKPINLAATAIHNITNEMVKESPTWPAMWPQIRSIFFNRSIGAYNADFDLRMISQSFANYRLPFRETLNMFDIMQLYANFRGEWDPIRRRNKWFRLEDAGKALGIAIPNSHRAKDDTLLARAVLHSIAGIPYN